MDSTRIAEALERIATALEKQIAAQEQAHREQRRTLLAQGRCVEANQLVIEFAPIQLVIDGATLAEVTYPRIEQLLMEEASRVNVTAPPPRDDSDDSNAAPVVTRP
jgi:hypothetical protein